MRVCLKRESKLLILNNFMKINYRCEVNFGILGFWDFGKKFRVRDRLG